jgi:S-DNA-T family DNA segregation ATPase FtsK/SpoIIIE
MPLSTQRELDVLTQLVQLVARRANEEEEIRSRLAQQTKAADLERDTAQAVASERYDQEKDRLTREYAAARQGILDRFAQSDAAVRREYEKLNREIPALMTEAKAEAQTKRKEVRWEASTVFDATKNQPPQQLTQIKKQLASLDEQLHDIEADAGAYMNQRRLPVPAYEPGTAGVNPAAHSPNPAARAIDPDALTACRELTGAAHTLLDRLRAVKSTMGMMLPAAKREASRIFVELQATIARADAAREQALADATAESQRQFNELVMRRDVEISRAEQIYGQAAARIEAEERSRLAEVEERFRPRLAEPAERRDREMAQADAKYPALLAALDETAAVEAEQIRAKHARRTAENGRRHQRDHAALVEEWQAGYSKIEAALVELAAENSRLFGPWESYFDSNWPSPPEVPAGIRFGEFEVSLEKIRGGISSDEQLRQSTTAFTLPALTAFPDKGSLLIKAHAEGRAAAVQTLQAFMLRLLTAMPPGKIRFTIVDPMGLGENFSAFMHLADFDEQLVTSRIWTETAHIEQRLADLTEHMENVIQKYLRNEFASIEEYNAQAGEVAEPYRFLVIANFPSSFSEEAARRLVSIATTGARCGVYTLISVDTRQPLPHHFELSDLEERAEVLNWKNGRFAWQHGDLEKLPLALDAPPAPDECTRIVREAGRRAKDAHRVEVPFEMVAPPSEKQWTHTTKAGVDVPLGRAGATKLQHLRLGKGTSQHVLIAGKTGSGKSTLLHALITNAALCYSPDELELYLIDFKKGVEFKTYATLELPHARVIAIESEREFGLSVLQRLDAELKRRGDLFRDAGVQDLTGYRAARPDRALPRVLFIVDEFQEFFVEDDRLSQEAALLLDRLVRQGRAFGMHVLLGSQTLGGAYSLARSTLGQMAVRIALQCSEADAHLILSEDNTAARLLTRPGEAIYNDANGLLEGNHPFQVVWLSDERKEAYLRRIRELAERHRCAVQPPIVFEGNLPADPSLNPLLASILAATTWPEPPRAALAWLGAAIAIKDPTAAVFRRQAGANLLAVGQQPEAAVGMLTTAIVSLAAQFEPGRAADATEGNGSPAATGARFFVLDGMLPDAPEAGWFRRLAGVLPHAMTVVTSRDVPRIIGEIAAEVSRRESASGDEAPPWFLIAFDLGRLRDLRKADDDFGFGGLGEDKPANPARQFAHILREGPALGVHTLAWCDSYNNVQRVLDRQGMRDFEVRVLFQMSGGDSSNLIDSPAAGKLGVHRALLYSEEQGQLEKFRPYGLPGEAWLAAVRLQLDARSMKSPAVVSS